MAETSHTSKSGRGRPATKSTASKTAEPSVKAQDPVDAGVVQPGARDSSEPSPSVQTPAEAAPDTTPDAPTPDTTPTPEAPTAPDAPAETGEGEAPSTGIARPTTAGNITQTSTAAPLEAPGDLNTQWPQDGHTQNDPPEGLGHASTNPIADVTEQSNLAGEDHVAIVDDEGREVDFDDAFVDGGAHQTFVTAKYRMWEMFQYPGTTTPMRRLLVAGPGAKMTKGVLAGLKAAQPKAQAQRAQRDV